MNINEYGNVGSGGFFGIRKETCHQWHIWLADYSDDDNDIFNDTMYLRKYVSTEDETKSNGIEIEENPQHCPQMNLMITMYSTYRPTVPDLSRWGPDSVSLLGWKGGKKDLCLF